MNSHAKYERFVQRFCTWADSMGYPLRIRRLLPDGLRRLASHISERDKFVEIVVRAMPLNHSLSICAESMDSWVYSTEDKVIFGAISPSWRGVGSITKCSDVNDLLSDFARLGAQYIARSRIARAQFSLSVSGECAYDFRGANEMMILTKDKSDISSARIEVDKKFVKSRKFKKRNSRQAQFWICSVNSLDPFIHRIIYQYWRSVSLFNDEYFEDSIGCLDSIVAICAEALHHWRLSAEQPTRVGTARLLSLSSEDQKMASKLYSLRCGFASHPPQSKWWDFYEVYEEEFSLYFDFVIRLMKKFFMLERSNRRVDPLPDCWGDWILENAEMLFDVVWFSRLPRADVREIS